MYSYRNDAVLDLPMRMGQHSPNYVYSTEQLADSNMEYGDAPNPPWDPVNDALLSKTTDSPHSGRRALRITYNGTFSPGAAQSAVMTAGVQYRIRGWARSDGAVNYPRVYDGGILIWEGIASTDWQEFDITRIAASANIIYYNRALIGGYCDFDDCSIKAVDPVTVDVSGNGNHAVFGDGVTAARYPTKRAYGRGYSFDGVNDYLGLGTATINGLINGAPGVTLGVALQYRTLSALNWAHVVMASKVNSTQDGLWLNIRGDVGNVGVVRVGGRSTPGDAFQAALSTRTLDPRSVYTIVGVLDFGGDLIRIYIDGELEVETAVTFGSDTYTAGTPTLEDRIGDDTTSRYIDCIMNQLIINPSVLSSIQIADLHKTMMKKINDV